MSRVFGLVLLLAIALCAGEEPQAAHTNSAAPPNRTFAQKRTINGVGNFGEVTPMLFRGARPTQEGLQALAKLGVEIVVDASHSVGSGEEKEVRQLGMQYVGIPWQCSSPRDEVLVKFLTVLQENPERKVFVHCRLGEDRTGMMVAAYRMSADGWTADEAMQEMHLFGFTAFHHVLCPGLASYEKSFPEHMAKNPALAGVRPANHRKPQ